ncbi:MAG TPA: class I SAM-dependent methyltransferase [Armatimonadota bacterium]|nr:class I SAM-dependent methyltransferase [Armatimonadota bacterium]
MPDLAILVPTRGRPGNVRNVINAWDFTNGWDHADLILIVDADDPQVDGYHQILREFVEAGRRGLQIVHMDRWMPMVHKLDLAARELAGRYWALGFAGDDHLPQTIGWAERYVTVLRELRTGMVYGDDGYQGAKLSTEWAMTSDVIRELGRMVPAPVEHMFCDNAVLDLFTSAGAARHLPEIRIEHMHPAAGKAQTDEQYQRVNSRDQMSRDRRAYQTWQSGERAVHVKAVRALRAGHPEERPIRPVRTPTRGRTTNVKPPRHFKRVRAATPEDVMMALADFASQVPADQEIIELGVFQGRSALQLAWGASLGHGAHVTGIDPWDLPGNVYDPPFTEESSRRWAFHHVKTLGFSRRISLVHGFSADVARTYSGPPVGLLYVDGDHTKEGARRDIEAWAPHLAPGATIAVDDYHHPDWPGVAEAVDELVAEGVLEPVQVFHDRLAVTRLTTTPEEPGRTTAVTSEGVHPSPEPEDRAAEEVYRDAVESGLSDYEAREEAWPSAGEPEPPHAPPVDTGESELTPHPDSDMSTDRMTVRAGELEDVAEGTPVDDLGTVQLRALARVREIKLGARKDKRADMLQAIRDGR